MKLGRYLLCVLAVAAGCDRTTTTTTTTESEAKAPPIATPTPTPTPAPAPGPASANDDPWSRSPPKRDPLPRPMLWAAAKDGKTTYFLGTMHMGIDAENRMPDLVWSHFDAAPAFAMETDLNGPSALKMQEDMTKRDHGTIHEDLGPAYWKKLQAAVGAAVADRLDTMQVAVPATMLSLRGLPQTPPMDSFLRARAENQHKTLVFLEDAATDGKILSKWMDAKALESILDDLPGGEKRSKDMLAAYAAGDDVKLAAISDDERAESLKHGYTAAEADAEMKDLLWDRNASWIAPLEKLHAGGGGFVAVGALHLIGPKSVLALLQKDGFTVSRVTP